MRWKKRQIKEEKVVANVFCSWLLAIYAPEIASPLEMKCRERAGRSAKGKMVEEDRGAVIDLRETFSHDLLVPRKIGDMARTPLGKTRSLPLQCLAEVLEVKIKEGTSCQDEQYGTLPRVFRDRKSLRQ